MEWFTRIIVLIAMLVIIIAILFPVGRWKRESLRYRLLFNGGLASLMIYIFPMTWGMTDNAVIYNTPLLFVVPLAFFGGFISLQVKRSSKIAEILIIVAVLMSLAGLLSSILS